MSKVKVIANIYHCLREKSFTQADHNLSIPSRENPITLEHNKTHTKKLLYLEAPAIKLKP